MIKKDLLINAIEVILKNLQNLSEEEINKIINKEVKLTCCPIMVKKENEQTKIVKKSNLKSKQKKQENDLEDEISIRADKIKNMDSREEVRKYITKEKLTKEKIVLIAKCLQIHIPKKDRREVMIEKLIEGSIGSKLKFEAIKNCDIRRVTE